MDGGALAGSAQQSLARALLPAAGADFRVSCRITLEQGAAAGLIVRGGERGDAGYYLRLEPTLKTVSLWRYPRPWVVARPLATRITPDLDYHRTLELKVLLHRHVLDAYLDNRHLFSMPVHDYRDGACGVFVEDASARFAQFDARALNE